MENDTEFNDELIVAPMDINNFVGAAEGRMGPWVLCLTIGLSPLILVPYLLQFIPLILVICIEIIWFVIVLAYTVGDHRNTVKKYKEQLEDEYSSSYKLLNIKKIWETGCIEYMTRKVAYMIVCESAEKLDDDKYSEKLEAFYDQIFSRKYAVDVYFQNVEVSSELASRYKLAKNFSDNEARDNYIRIIDHNIKLAMTKSQLMRTVLIVEGRRADFKDLHQFIQEALSSKAMRVFKCVELYSNQDRIEEVLSRDLDTHINYTDLMRRKYRTGKYYGSKIIGYDLVDKVVERKKKNNIRGFMIR